MTLSKFRTTSYLITTVVFFISLFLANLYIDGDQFYYIRAYSGIQEYDFIESFDSYRDSLYSREIIHFLLIWIFSFFDVNKLVFDALFSSLLAYVTMILLRKWQVSIYIAISLVLTNFYFIVLYFSAERLKFGVLFFILSLIYIERWKIMIMLASFSFLSHVSLLVLYLSILFSNFIDALSKIFITKRMSKRIFYFIPLIMILYIVMYPYMLTKLSFYSNSIGLLGFWKIILFFVATLLYSDSKTTTLYLFIILFMAIYFVGGERVNMFAYFVFLYYALRVNNGLNFGILVTTIYFAFKSIFFIINIFNYGDGFYDF